MIKYEFSNLSVICVRKNLLWFSLLPIANMGVLIWAKRHEVWNLTPLVACWDFSGKRKFWKPLYCNMKTSEPMPNLLFQSETDMSVWTWPNNVSENLWACYFPYQFPLFLSSFLVFHLICVDCFGLITTLLLNYSPSCFDVVFLYFRTIVIYVEEKEKQGCLFMGNLCIWVGVGSCWYLDTFAFRVRGFTEYNEAEGGL